MKSLTRLAAVSAASAALVLGSAAASFAQSTTIDDKRYDVLFGDNGQRVAKTGSYAEKIAARNIDVDKLNISHGKDFVKIDVDLHRFASYDAGVEAYIDVPGGNVDNFFFVMAPDGDGGIYSYTYETDEGEGGTFCSSESETRRIQGNTKSGLDGHITAYVPRACFENPSQLRVQSAALFEDRSISEVRSGATLNKIAAEPTDQTYIDIISSKYFLKPQLTGWLKRN